MAKKFCLFSLYGFRVQVVCLQSKEHSVVQLVQATSHFFDQRTSTRMRFICLLPRFPNFVSFTTYVSDLNLYYTRDITPKHGTSGGSHLRGLVPGQHSSERRSGGEPLARLCPICQAR